MNTIFDCEKELFISCGTYRKTKSLFRIIENLIISSNIDYKLTKSSDLSTLEFNDIKLKFIPLSNLNIKQHYQV